MAFKAYFGEISFRLDDRDGTKWCVMGEFIIITTKYEICSHNRFSIQTAQTVWPAIEKPIQKPNRDALTNFRHGPKYICFCQSLLLIESVSRSRAYTFNVLVVDSSPKMGEEYDMEWEIITSYAYESLKDD